MLNTSELEWYIQPLQWQRDSSHGGAGAVEQQVRFQKEIPESVSN